MEHIVERSLVLLKPDALERGLAGEILSRFERKGLKILACKSLRVTEELARRHYAEHVNAAYFPEILSYITRGPILALVISGPNAVSVIRRMMGDTDGSKAPIGTIRGDFSLSKRENLVHASDSIESASREIPLFFRSEEIL